MHFWNCALFAFLVAVSTCGAWNQADWFEDESCKTEAVETIPVGVNLSSSAIPTVDSFVQLIDSSQQSLQIAAFYVALTASDELGHDASAEPGRRVMNAIEQAVQRGVKLEVVIDGSQRRSISQAHDVDKLKSLGQLQYLNMTEHYGDGLLHTKLILVDEQSFYLGSANMDWRSLAHVKETGLAFRQCPKLARDMGKIFRTYQMRARGQLGGEPTLRTAYTHQRPLNLQIYGQDSSVYLSASPPSAMQMGSDRTDDLEAVLKLIKEAKKRIDISVMNYSPRTSYTKTRQYMSAIDDALRRRATEDKIKIRLLFSSWPSTKSMDIAFYKSLNALKYAKEFAGGSIEVRLLRVPALDDYQRSIPFARVKHDKYMVTDQGLLVGTNNWTPEYFSNTCGISVVLQRENAVVQQYRQIFQRDWNSNYTMSMWEAEQDWNASFNKQDKPRTPYIRKSPAAKEPANGTDEAPGDE